MKTILPARDLQLQIALTADWRGRLKFNLLQSVPPGHVVLSNNIFFFIQFIELQLLCTSATREIFSLDSIALDFVNNSFPFICSCRSCCTWREIKQLIIS